MSEKLISQRDFLHEKISIFEIDHDGELKIHERLTEENVYVLSFHHCEKVSEVTDCHHSCSNEISAETECA